MIIWQNKRSKIKMSNRERISRQLATVLCFEMLEFKLYKLDIKNFFDTVPKNEIVSLLSGIGMPDIYTQLINKTISIKPGPTGLPQGLPISSFLAELYLKEFDRTMLKQKNNLFYSRFVDDIILLTTGQETFDEQYDFVKSVLPREIVLNDSKTYYFNSNNFRRKKEMSFEYLGYRYNMVARRKKRSFSIDLGAKKENKIKQRIYLSLAQFEKTLSSPLDKERVEGGFKDLRDRINYITGNVEIDDFKKQKRIKTGLSYSHRLIDGSNSPSLSRLDRFIYGQITRILNDKSKMEELRTQLPSVHNDLTSLLKVSIKTRFNKKYFISFSNNRLNEIKQAWKYE